MATGPITETFFGDIVENRADYLRDLKRNSGRKIFGYFCTYSPEELLHAAGLHSVRLFGGTEEISQADTLLQTYVCPFVRGVLDMALKGGYDFLDGVVHAYTCDATCGLFGIWQRNIKTDFTYTFSPPYFLNESSLRYMVRELMKLKAALEGFTGGPISDEALRRSIDVINRKRQVLKRLYAIRSANPSPVSGRDVLKVVLAGSIMPPEEFAAAVEAYIERVLRPSGCGQDRHRIFISGSELHDAEILAVIEETGAVVVGDDLCNGSRAFSDLVEPAENPYEALARRYIGRSPCPSRLPVARRLQFILEGVKESRAQALIFLIQKFCDPHLAEQPLLSEWLKQNGIPNMVIETEHRIGPSRGQIKTRIESFLEMISR